MISEYILKDQMLLQKFRDLLWRTKLMKSFANHGDKKYDFASDNEESEDGNED